MFNNITDDGHGRVSIGTLIVFIAVALIATITAGVLVNMAGFLQVTTEGTGEQSVNKVTNRVEALDTRGTVGGEKDIDNITLTIRLATGSDTMDMNETSIKYLSGNSVVTLTNQMITSGASSATNDSVEGVADNDEFSLSEVTDDDGSFGVLNSMNDRCEVTIDAAAIETSDGDNTNLVGGLSTGERVTLEITSRTGGTTQVILTMLQQLVGKTQNGPAELWPGTKTFLSFYRRRLPNGSAVVCSKCTTHSAARSDDAVGYGAHVTGNAAAESGR